MYYSKSKIGNQRDFEVFDKLSTANHKDHQHAKHATTPIIAVLQV